VLEGEVLVQTRDSSGGPLHEVRLKPGQAIATLPTQTLSFANAGDTDARVLFVCAPPYPSDDSDTLVIDTPSGTPSSVSPPDAPPLTPPGHTALHRDLTPDEIERALARHEQIRQHLFRVIDERIAALRTLLERRAGG
jgi:hypothetical protein